MSKKRIIWSFLEYFQKSLDICIFDIMLNQSYFPSYVLEIELGRQVSLMSINDVPKDENNERETSYMPCPSYRSSPLRMVDWKSTINALVFFSWILHSF